MNMFSQWLRNLRFNLSYYTGFGEKYSMSGRSDGCDCAHNNVYVREIYERENLPINIEDGKRNGFVPVAIEYLTLICIDCSNQWNGKRTINKPVEVKIGNSTSGLTGYIPAYFTEIRGSECEHLKFNVNNNTINYINPRDLDLNMDQEQDHYTETDCTQGPSETDCTENQGKQLWAFGQAECRYCRNLFSVKRNYVEKTTNQQTVNEFAPDSEWVKCKITLN
jgi:hypothetical protein